jgi:UDP-N-acetyl-D-glucosamine dehydrogenase
VLGIAYKKDIDDERESPGYAIMNLLMKKGADVSYNDPWIPQLKPTRKYQFTKQSVPVEPQILADMDAVIIVTDHSAYDFPEIVKHARLVVDTRNATRGIDAGLDKIMVA